MPKAIKPPKAPLKADAMNKYAMRIPASSLVYQLSKKRVIEGKRHPSKNPRKILVVTSPAKLFTKPVHRHTSPHAKVMAGMTLLNCKRFTRIEVGNCGEN